MATLALCCRPSIKYEAYSEVTSAEPRSDAPRRLAAGVDGIAKSKKFAVATSAADRDSNVRDAPRGGQDSSAPASSKPTRTMCSSGTQTVVRVIDHLPSRKTTCSSPQQPGVKPASPEATVTTPLKTVASSDAGATPSRRDSKGGSSRKTAASGGKSLAERPIWRV